MADNIPKVLKVLFLFLSSKEFINLLVLIQYSINNIDAKIIEGLKTR